MSARAARTGRRRRRPAPPPKAPGLFLDRDGTLLRLVPYLADPARARLVSGAAAELRRLQEAGWRIVVVTNQAGIARGLMTRRDVAAVNRRLMAMLAVEGVWVDAIEVCPHHPDFSGPCRCRKPHPAMITRAARRLRIDLGRSWTIGDSGSDLLAGEAAGTGTAVVATGYGRRTARLPVGKRAGLRGRNLAAVLRRIGGVDG